MSFPESATYWKGKYEELEHEFSEFREQSQMLEKELESSLEYADKQVKEFKIKNNKMLMENDGLKERYNSLYESSKNKILELEEERAQWHKREENFVKYIRELEQKNDDLERSHRAVCVSLGELETKLNSALERNVLLESELDDREALQIMVQRLKDETRDLRQEVNLRDNCEITKKSATEIMDCQNHNAGSVLLDNNQTINKDSNIKKSLNGSLSITPANKISAMNIVGDLLRRVGALETKLASFQNGIHPSANGSREYSRTKQLNRGMSSPSLNNSIGSSILK